MADHPNNTHPSCPCEHDMEEAIQGIHSFMEDILHRLERAPELEAKIKSVAKELWDVKMQVVVQTARNDRLRSKLRETIIRAKDARKALMDARGTIRVFCRILPSNNPVSAISQVGPTSLTVTRRGGKEKEFEVDRVYDQGATQEDVFSEISDLVDCVIAGEKVCLIAHGYTGTGKTYTITGKPTHPGILQRSMERIFSEENSSLVVKVAMTEIYVDKMYNLLIPKGKEGKELELQKSYVEAEGITKEPVTSVAKCLELYEAGLKRRHTSSTSLNSQSSRGHVVFSILISKDSEPHGSLYIVDLAGSEKMQGERQQIESISINKSVFELKMLILNKRNGATYRFGPNLLTRYLQPCLEGKNKVLFIMTVSPEMEMVDKTIDTLEFAKTAIDCPCPGEP